MAHPFEGPAPVGATPRDSALTEWLLRAFAMLAYGVMVWVVAQHWWADRGRLSLLLLLVSEGFTLALVVFARRAVVRDIALGAPPAAATAAAAGLTAQSVDVNAGACQQRPGRP